MKTRRNKKGSAVALATVLALVLVVLGVAFLIFSLYMGGQRETKNAVDAGVLNIGKQVLDQVSVPLDGSESQLCFLDVTNNSNDLTSPDDGKVDLRRINRVWGKAMLIAINAAAADIDHNAGSGESNASDAAQGAQQISDALSTQLKTASNLFGFFTNFSQANSVRMIATNASVAVLPNTNWATASMDRGSESNLVLSGSPPNFNLPPGYSLPSDSYTQCTRTPMPADAANLYFLKGYTPLTIGSNTFWQVPFQYQEKPHLVSKTVFDPANTPVSGWNLPVPNAFSAEGVATKTKGTSETAISWALTNPNQPFKMSMPHSFLHIHLDQMVAKFLFFPSGYPPTEWGVPDQNYGYTPSELTPGPAIEGGILCASVDPGTVEIGEDVAFQPLDSIIFGSPGSDPGDSQLEAYMTNRMNEMVGQIDSSGQPVSISTAQMHQVLQDPKTIAELASGSINDFYVFSPDGINVVVQPEAQAVVSAPWLATMISNDPDGTETALVSDESTIDPMCPPPFGFIPDVEPDPDCELLPPPIGAAGWETWEKALNWTPGTGYNGCLGQVRVTRWTNVDSWGLCYTTVI